MNCIARKIRIGNKLFFGDNDELIELSFLISLFMCFKI